MLQLFDSLLGNVVVRVLKVPSVDDQLLEKLAKKNSTVCLSAGTQKLSSA